MYVKVFYVYLWGSRHTSDGCSIFTNMPVLNIPVLNTPVPCKSTTLLSPSQLHTHFSLSEDFGEEDEEVEEEEEEDLCILDDEINDPDVLVDPDPDPP